MEMILFASLVYVYGMFYFFTVMAHRKILPHFEAVAHKEETRTKRVGKFVAILFGVVGFIGTLIAIVQLFSPK